MRGVCGAGLGLALVLGAGGCRVKSGDSSLRAGIACIGGKNPEAAVLHLKAAIRERDDNASAHCNLGIAYWQQGRTDIAVESLRWASDLAIEDSRPLEFIGAIFCEERKWDAARIAFNEAYARQPSSPRILTSMALVEYHSGNTNTARSLLGEALSLDINYQPALYNMAVLWRDGSGNPDLNRHRAARYFEMYVRAMDAEAAKSELGESDRKHLESARKFIAPPEAAPPEAAGPVSRAAPGPVPRRAEAAPPPDRAERPDALLSAARDAVSAERYDEALILFGKAVEERPENPDALWELAQFYRDQLRFEDESAEVYRRFAATFPNDHRASRARDIFVAHRSARRLAVAGPVTRPAGAADSSEAESTEKRNKRMAIRMWAEGMERHKAKDMAGAMSFYKRALQYDPACVNATYNLGLVYRASGDYARAAEMFRLTLKTKLDMADASYMLGVAYRDMGEKDKAMKQLVSTLKTDPEHAKTHYLLGLLYREQNSPVAAKLHFEEHVRLSPDSASAKDAMRWLNSLGERERPGAED